MVCRGGGALHTRVHVLLTLCLCTLLWGPDVVRAGCTSATDSSSTGTLGLTSEFVGACGLFGSGDLAGSATDVTFSDPEGTVEWTSELESLGAGEAYQFKDLNIGSDGLVCDEVDMFTPCAAPALRVTILEATYYAGNTDFYPSTRLTLAGTHDHDGEFRLDRGCEIRVAAGRSLDCPGCIVKAKADPSFFTVDTSASAVFTSDPDMKDMTVLMQPGSSMTIPTSIEISVSSARIIAPASFTGKGLKVENAQEEPPQPALHVAGAGTVTITGKLDAKTGGGLVDLEGTLTVTGELKGTGLHIARGVVAADLLKVQGTPAQPFRLNPQASITVTDASAGTSEMQHVHGYGVVKAGTPGSMVKAEDSVWSAVYEGSAGLLALQGFDVDFNSKGLQLEPFYYGADALGGASIVAFQSVVRPPDVCTVLPTIQSAISVSGHDYAIEVVRFVDANSGSLPDCVFDTVPTTTSPCPPQLFLTGEEDAANRRVVMVFFDDLRGGDCPVSWEELDFADHGDCVCVGTISGVDGGDDCAPCNGLGVVIGENPPKSPPSDPTNPLLFILIIGGAVVGVGTVGASAMAVRTRRDSAKVLQQEADLQKALHKAERSSIFRKFQRQSMISLASPDEVDAPPPPKAATRGRSHSKGKSGSRGRKAGGGAAAASAAAAAAVTSDKKKRNQSAGAARSGRRAGSATVPTSVIEALYYIEDRGIIEEGIFRVSGSKAAVDSVLAQLRMHPAGFDASGDPDVHAVASAFKQYLREMHPRLVSSKAYGRIATALDTDTPGAVLTALKSLPPASFELLKRIATVCHNIAEKEAVNKMGAQQLATVLGPNLVEGDQMQDGVRLLYYCAQHARELFNLAL